MRNSSVAAWPIAGRPFKELSRLRKATLYTDIVEAGGISVEHVDGFTEGQWNALALIAKGKRPSTETCAVIRQRLRQRQAWRELVAREKGSPHAA